MIGRGKIYRFLDAHDHNRANQHSLAKKVRLPRMKMKLKKIVSGGQTGVDRACLDFAIKHRIRHGGWCPRGRLAEDGRIPARYKLKETPRASYAQRTESNVRDSDATVIFSISPRLRGGTW